MLQLGNIDAMTVMDKRRSIAVIGRHWPLMACRIVDAGCDTETQVIPVLNEISRESHNTPGSSLGHPSESGPKGH